MAVSNTSKTRQRGPSSEATISVSFVDEAKLVLLHCLASLHEIDGPYFYASIGCASSIPGNLSHLLCVRDEQLVPIYQSCGFYNIIMIFFPTPYYRRVKCSDHHHKIQDTRYKIQDTRYKIQEADI
jgi:hypothetical protein